MQMNQNNIVIASLHENYIDEIVEIEKLSFAIPWSKDAFLQEYFHNPQANYVVALSEDQVVGYGGFWIIFDEAHITNIAVHPNFRGQKIGTCIVEAMIEKAASQGVNSLTLEVRKSNTVAQSLYEKYGFLSVGVRPKYYSDNGEDAVIMWRS